ncbi:hypothetical protein [Pedobacter sandarakinus]|uniref:hypothetical protein n=1 Tax=Pedobacter sandarakinus TaxID=353156 RepID=UPI0022458718|nr:hypothetical protein [Pedobacter sandarakinus]MCX2575021.1 hypothetical protein [Pedobacter sandarakinus]
MRWWYTCLIFLLPFCSYAQKSDSTHTHYRLIRGGFVEHVTSLKSNIRVKNGMARIQSGKKIIASGLYKDNERYGRWSFYNQLDSLAQIYNYTTKKVEYNPPSSTIYFEIDSLKPGDKVIRAMRIGGDDYGLFF